MKLDMIDMIHRYRSYGWSKRAICRQWGICAKTLHEVEGCRTLRKSPDRQALNAITPAEKRAVVNYALAHTELNHREMAYRMIDEDIAFMSPSSVYRILRDRNLLAIRESKPKGDLWDPHQYPGKANEIWQTDLMIIRYRGADFFLLSYIDVFSRFIPYHELLTSMTGDTIKEATRRALLCCPECPANIQSDNGSGFISVEYRSYLSKNDIQHRRIHPYCPNENAEVERYHRTLRELIDPDDAGDFDQLIQLVKDRIDYYNNTRYHSAIGFVTPHSKYTGKADQIIQERERKLARAREQRKQQNLSLMKNKAA